MRSLGLFLIWSVLLFAATQEVSGDCEYRRDEVPEGRTCKKKCTKNSDCKGKNKICECDNLCGMSCFNPRLKCPLLRILPNARTYYGSLVYGSKVLYSCRAGFELKGNAERVCQSDGKWSGNAPKCAESEKIECSPLSAVVPNGQTDYSSSASGSKVTYSCNKRFKLKGKAGIVCQSNGEWSGRPPRCEESGGCKYPPTISAGFANTAQSVFKVGDVVQYKCRHGYKAQGDRNSICLDDGTWSARDIICSEVNCGDPGQPLHGRAVGDSFLFGSLVTYVCDEGYELSDLTKQSNERRYCSTSGRWVGNIPTCLVKSCFPPRPPKHAYVDYFDLDFGSVVKYFCQQGYVLNGSKEGRCMDDGSWGEVPTCEVDINCNFDAFGRQYCGYLNTGDVQWQTQYLQKSRSSYPDLQKYSWFIGQYNIRDGLAGAFIIRAVSNEIYPDKITNHWMDSWNNVNVDIRKNDMWGPWSEFPCSVTCGLGKKRYRRFCVGGSPGSMDCKGSAEKSELCVLSACEERNRQ